MKKILLVCCLLLGIAAVSRAQGMRRSPEERAKQLQTQLKLTDDQTAKITVIYTAMNSKMDSVRNAGGDFSSFRPTMTSTAGKIKAVLTPEQATAYQKIIDERRARMQQGGGGN